MITIDRRKLMLRAGYLAAGFGAGGVLVSQVRSQALDYLVAPVIDGGSLVGTLKINGKAPEPDRFVIGKDNHVCGDGHAAHDIVAVAPNAGITNAVVALRGVKQGRGWPTGPTYTVTQEKCAFHPYLQVVPADAEVTIHNKDPLLHNIHAYELIGRARRTLFNIAQPQAGQIDRHRLALRRGHVVELDCDAHNWMSAWLYASPHPYVTVTADEGSFVMKDVPPGNYELVAWHPLLAPSVSAVTISARGETRVELQIASA